LQTLSKSIFLLLILVIITCGIYPLALWIIGQTVFPFQANGSMLADAKGNIIGSKLIAQPFVGDEYFQPRPSAAYYDASASASSSLAASNYILRDRVARTLGPIVKYQNGKPVAADIEKWFQQDVFQGNHHIVAEWARLHNSLAQTWVSSDASHSTYVDSWGKVHPAVIAQFIKDNPNTPSPKAADLALVFFQHFSSDNPGKFPSAVTHATNGKTLTTIEAVNTGTDIQSLFFDMWRQDHPDAILQDVPGDLVTTSGSGLDPHITLQNALFQMPRVANYWTIHLKRNPVEMANEIQQILQENAEAPFCGLAGEHMINVLQVNLELQKRYGQPSTKT